MQIKVIARNRVGGTLAGLPSASWLMLAIMWGLDTLALSIGAISAHLQQKALTSVIIPGLHRHLDVAIFAKRFEDFGKTSFFSLTPKENIFNYPAIMALPLRWLYLHDAYQSYSNIFFIWLGVLAVFFVVALKRSGVRTYIALPITILFLAGNFPLHLLYFMNNLELIVWMTTSIGILALYCDREKTAAICFGIGGAMKYFPLLLLAVFPVQKKWGRILLGIFACSVTNLIGLVYLGPTIATAWTGLRKDSAEFAHIYLLQYREVDATYDHSLFALCKCVLHLVLHIEPPTNSLVVYLSVVTVGLAVLYVRKLDKLPLLNRLMAFTILAVWLMPVSQDYTLVHLLTPLALLVLRLVKEGGKSSSWNDRALLFIFTCFGLLFGALTFVHEGIVGYGGAVRSLLLGILFICFLKSRSVQTPPSERSSAQEIATLWR